MSAAWIALLIAGALEVVWAAGFKFAFKDQHWITAGTVAAMAGSFVFLNIAMRSIPIGTAYAVWTGIGAVGAAIVGVVFFKEPATALRIIGICLVLAGIAALKLSAAP